MKQRILFVIDSLGVGGAEKSLVTLLNLLDYTRFEVDIQLFAYGGVFEQFLPKEVNVLSPLDYTQFLDAPLWKQILQPRKMFARVRYSMAIRKQKLLHADKAVEYWKSVGQTIAKSERKYDIAIAYAQGVPTFYVIDKVDAPKKMAWVNVDYRLQGTTRDFQRNYYEALDVIVPVSDSSYKTFSEEVYPEFKDKMHIIWDINDSGIITRMSLLPSDKPIDHSLPVIMTAGRLNKPQKGYDLALGAAKILRDRGVKFRWYAVGEGPYRPEMEAYILENRLEDTFVLLGATPNPYAYMRQCDVYVQTSRHEGFGLTIAEARILNRPVVCTNFEACTMQMKDGQNGLVVDMDPEAIANGVEKLLNDKVLYDRIQEYLKCEKKGNTEEIEKFYSFING